MILKRFLWSPLGPRADFRYHFDVQADAPKLSKTGPQGCRGGVLKGVGAPWDEMSENESFQPIFWAPARSSFEAFGHPRADLGYHVDVQMASWRSCFLTCFRYRFLITFLMEFWWVWGTF